MGYPLASSSWDQEEITAIRAVVDSGMFTMGERVAEFEQELAQFVGSKFCVMVNSGSSANLLMVAALRYRKVGALRPGDEVIVPAVSWSTTYYPLYQYGLRLKFVDIDRHTLNYDLDALSSAITSSTKALMVVNLLGNPNDFGRIRQILEDREIIMLEDNCESMGATFQDKQAGTFGLMGTFSSFFSHHISTMEGGMIVTDDEELYHILLALRAHGWTRNLPKHNHVCGVKSDVPFEESFRFVVPGYNVRPLELSGAIGIQQLKKLPGIVRTRRLNANHFLELVGKYPFVRTQREVGRSSWFGFSLVIDDETGRITRSTALRIFREKGIETRPIVAGNFAKNEVLRWFDYSIHGELKHAEEADKNGFFIGNHHYPLDHELGLLKEALDELAG